MINRQLSGSSQFGRHGNGTPSVNKLLKSQICQTGKSQLTFLSEITRVSFKITLFVVTNCCYLPLAQCK